MTSVCLNCGVGVDDAGASCPECGEENPVEGSVTGGDRIASALAYFALVPALIFLLLERFKTNRFVRFHCFQAIFLVAASLILAGAQVSFVMFSILPFLISWLIVTIVSLACFTLWVVLLVKALQGRRFKLPWLGAMADKQARG